MAKKKEAEHAAYHGRTTCSKAKQKAMPPPEHLQRKENTQQFQSHGPQALQNATSWNDNLVKGATRSAHPAHSSKGDVGYCAKPDGNQRVW